MTSEECQSLADNAVKETNLIKMAIAYNQASQCYKKNEDNDQFIAMKRKAIEVLQGQAKKIEEPYEKSLVHVYEALCWLCIGELEKAEELTDNALKMVEAESKFETPTIIGFIKHLIKKEIEGAEDLWRDLYQHFYQGIVDLMEEAFISVHPEGNAPVIDKPPAFTKSWQVLFAGKEPEDPEKDWTLLFYDSYEVVNEKPILKKEYLDDILKQVKEVEHYHFIRNMRSVTSSGGDDLTDKALFAILATSKEKKLKFGMILGSLKEGGVHIIALWPEAFAQATWKDKDILGAFIMRSAQKPEFFSDLNVLAFLSHEAEGGPEHEEKTLPDYFT